MSAPESDTPVHDGRPLAVTSAAAWSKQAVARSKAGERRRAGAMAATAPPEITGWDYKHGGRRSADEPAPAQLMGTGDVLADCPGVACGSHRTSRMSSPRGSANSGRAQVRSEKGGGEVPSAPLTR